MAGGGGAKGRSFYTEEEKARREGHGGKVIILTVSKLDSGQRGRSARSHGV